MKICEQCKILCREQVMACPECRGALFEVALQDALRLTEQKAFHHYISGYDLSADNIQYQIRSYIENRSLFLDFDIYKNRMKRGRRTRSFFIAPLNFTVLINLPWFIFNVLGSNLFHMQYTEFCPRCNAKYIKGRHNLEECEYNLEYFTILDDIANGRIVKRKIIFQEYCKNKIRRGWRSAYHDLFSRHWRWEVLGDLGSIGITVFFWLYLLVAVMYPLTQTMLQKIQSVESYERVLILR